MTRIERRVFLNCVAVGSLLTLIVLGEVILGITNAFGGAISENGF